MAVVGNRRAWALLLGSALAACSNGTGQSRDRDAGVDAGATDAAFACQGPWTPAAGPTSACVYAGRCASCWGSGFTFPPERQVIGSSTGYVAQLPSDIKSLVTGLAYGCALLTDGAVFCYGGNGKGELGNGEGGDGNYNTVKMTVVELGGVAVKALAGGNSHVCVLRMDGAVWCWGDNSYGQLGVGESGLNNNRPSPVKVDLGGAAVRTIVARGPRSCAVLVNGDVACWGENENLIRGHVGFIVTPTVVPLDGPVAELALGGTYCVRLESGPIECWGGTESTAPPAPVPGLDPAHVVWFGAGGGNGLALLDSGTLVGWGANTSGELGQLGRGPFPSATPIDTGGPVAAAAAGDFEYNCAILVGGAVKCWGNNSRMQLGISTGYVTTYGHTPAELPNVIIQ